jgi:hypothetical protein
LDGGRHYWRFASLQRTKVQSGVPERFYSSPEEAAQNIVSYLADPPQLYDARNWIDFDIGERIPRHLLDRPLYVVRLSVQPQIPSQVVLNDSTSELGPGDLNE